MPVISVQHSDISIISVNGQDYISLTDMANAKNDESRAADVIKNWLRNRYTLELLGTWELIHNPDFKVVEFDHFLVHAKQRLSDVHYENSYFTHTVAQILTRAF